MWDKLLDAILNHWCTVVSAPVPFIAIAALALFGGWFARKTWDRDNVELWRSLAGCGKRVFGPLSTDAIMHYDAFYQAMNTEYWCPKLVFPQPASNRIQRQIARCDAD